MQVSLYKEKGSEPQNCNSNLPTPHVMLSRDVSFGEHEELLEETYSNLIKIFSLTPEWTEKNVVVMGHRDLMFLWTYQEHP